MNKTLMSKIGFVEEMKLVKENKCPICKDDIKIKYFSDLLSVQEYKISGLCEKCQDNIFGGN